MNGDVLAPAKDMGEDAVPAVPNQPTIHPNDAAALSLDYFKGDYKPIGDTAVMHIAALGKNLYNGNIPRATTSIIPFPDLKSQYTYDQLNRIVRADYAYMNRSTAELTNTADYYSSYAYDPDGNLKKLVRNGNNPNAGQKQMDSLKYYYGNYTNYSTTNNRLVNITDWTPDNNYPNTGDITQYQQQYANRYTYDATGNVIQDLVSGQNSINWNHYNKVAYDYNYSQAQTLGFEYDGAGNRYLKSASGNGSKDTTSINNDYYVRDAQGNILAIYKDEADYVMTKQQWVEYITSQIYVRCNNRLDILNWYITPYYGNNFNFNNKILNYALTNNPQWAQGVVNNEDVSYYLQKGGNIADNFISGLYAHPSVFTDMANWGGDNQTNLIGPFLNQHLGFIDGNGDMGAEASQSFLSSLFVPRRPNPTNVEGGLLGMLCTYAPVLMETAMRDFGAPEYQTGTANCPENADNLNATLVNGGYSGTDLINELYALRKKNDAQYVAFLSQLYSSGTRYGVDEKSKQDGYNLLEALCISAPNIFRDIRIRYDIDDRGDCKENAAALYEVANPVNADNLKNLNNQIMDIGKKFPDEFGNLADALWSGRITTESDAAASDRVLAHLVETMPAEFMMDMMYNMSVDYDSKNAATWPDALKQHLEGKPRDAAFMGSNIMAKYAGYPNDNNDDGYHPYSLNNFIDSIVGDPVITASSYFADDNEEEGSGELNVGLGGQGPGLGAGLFRTCVGALQNYGFDYFDADKMYGFIDGWAQARTALEATSDQFTLMNAVYGDDQAGFINNYINAAGGSTDILSQSIAAIPDINLNGFVNNLYTAQARIQTMPWPQWCLKTIVIDSIVHAVYKQALHNRRFYLASHIMYGSSRLGTKDYLPGEYYKFYDNTGQSPIADTMTLGSLRTWYSLEYNDQIQGLALQPYGGTDITSFYASHQIGRKQYELSNHLGNVQATVSDLPFPYGEQVIEGYHPALPATYDYYPFGMLMPGRFTSDTANKCMTITQTQWVTQWIDSCYDAPWPETRMQRQNGALYSYIGNGLMEFNCERENSSISLDLDVAPDVEQVMTLDLDKNVFSGSLLLKLTELQNGTEVDLTSIRIERPGIYQVPFTPTTTLISAHIIGPVRVRTNHICVKKKVQVQQSYLVDICSKMKDRYRFGFNGQEKVNEWSGIGNFEDFGARGLDTRTGRWGSSDPKEGKYPSLSPYHFGFNNPIVTIDPNGEENVVVVAAENHSSNPNDKLMFMVQGIRQARIYQKASSEETNVLIFSHGYTKAQLAAFEAACKKYGVANVIQISNVDQLINYINSQDIASTKLSKTRTADPVSNLDIFSHGLRGYIALDFEGNRSNTNFTIQKIGSLDPKAFGPDPFSGQEALFTSYACRTGTPDDNGNNFAKSFASTTGTNIKAFYRRSNYSNSFAPKVMRDYSRALRIDNLVRGLGSTLFVKEHGFSMYNYMKHSYNSFNNALNDPEHRMSIDGALFDDRGAMGPVESGSTPKNLKSGQAIWGR